MAHENSHQRFSFTRAGNGGVRTRFMLHEDEADLIETAARATRTPVLTYMMRSIKQQAIDDLTELGLPVAALETPSQRAHQVTAARTDGTHVQNGTTRMNPEYTKAVHRVAGRYSPTAKGMLERCHDLVSMNEYYQASPIVALGESRERSRRQWEFLATPVGRPQGDPGMLRFTVELRENERGFSVAPVFTIARDSEIQLELVPHAGTRWEYVDARDDLTVDERWTRFIESDVEQITADVIAERLAHHGN